MDGFGHDVAQKIKSAIKAKLVELDAYVDDELPDYIMVMVANKKPKAQMTEDLSLFLGDNTTKFTSWLHEVLQRLQSVTLDGQRKTDIRPVNPEEMKPPDVIEVVSTSEKASTEKLNEGGNVFVEPLPKTSVPQKGSVAIVPVVLPVALSDVEIQDEMLTIKAEPESGDLLDEELRDDLAVTAAKPELPTRLISASHSLTRPAVASAYLTTKKSKPDEVTLAEKVNLPNLESLNGNNNPNSIKIPTTNSIAADVITQLMPSSLLSSRKRKTPCSTVGAVLQREFPQEEDDEEYDPRHPTIGAVASVVQVTQRRSSVPPERQANKVLLFKAVNEAEKSIHRASQRPALGPVRDSNEPLAQLFTKRYLERQRLEQQAQRQLELQQQPVVHKVKRLSVNRKSPDVLHKESLPEVYAEKIEEETLLQSPEPEKIDNQEVESEEQTDESLPEAVAMDTVVEDPARIVVLQDRTERIEAKPASPKFIITLDGVDATAFEPLAKENPWSDSGDYLVVNEDTASNTSDHDDLIIKEDVEAMAYSEMMDAEDSEDYENGDEDYSISPNKRQKLNERCRYWPGCKNGSECAYYHPTTHCKAFPNCKFGSKCLYIHPNCKFDSACTRRDCPFTHASPRVHQLDSATTLPVRLAPHPTRRQAILTAACLMPQKIKCRNFPTCSNVDCQYYHPKPCRYGQSCARSDCVFFHPPFPTPDKLKWNKKGKPQQLASVPFSSVSKRNISERKFALNQVQQTLPVSVEKIKV